MRIAVLATLLVVAAVLGARARSSGVKAAVSVAATALLVELLAAAWLWGRPVVEPHRDLIVAQPQYSAWGSMVPGTNWPATWFSETGHHPGPEPGRRSILFVGDSFTSGVGVPPGHSFPELVAASFTADDPPVDVWVHSRPGLNFPDLAALYESYSLSWSPDVVVWVWVLNDVPSNERERACGSASSGFDDLIRDTTATGFKSTGSIAVDMATIALHRRQSDLCIRDTYIERYAADSEPPHLAEFEAQFRELVSWQTQRGGRFILAIFPLMYRLQDYPFEDAHRAIAQMGHDAGAEVLDLYPAFNGLDETALWAHPTDHHPNERGHTLAAHAIIDVLGDALVESQPELCPEWGPDERALAYAARCQDTSSPFTWLAVGRAEAADSATPSRIRRVTSLVNLLQAGVLADPDATGVPDAPNVLEALQQWSEAGHSPEAP